MWDATNPNPPDISPLTINVGDVTITPTIVGVDGWGAWLFYYTLEMQYATDSPAFAGWSAWSTVGTAKQSSPNYVIDTKAYGVGPRAFRFRSTTYDKADNQSPTYMNPTVYIITAVGGWYGPAGPSSAFYDIIGGGVNTCPADAQPEAAQAVDELNGPNIEDISSYSRYYAQQSRINTTLPWYPNNVAWRMTCQRWDTRNPTVTAFTYGNTWSNVAAIPLNFTSTDVGGAGVWQYDLEMMYSDSSPSFIAWWTTWTNIATIAGWLTSYAYTDATRPATTNRAYKFRIKARDNANNSSPYLEPVTVYKLDTTVPNPANLTTTTPLNLLATNAQLFNFTFTDPGSPVRLTSQIEDFNNKTLFIPSFNPSAYLNLFTTANHDISNVDTGGWDRIQDSNTARQYTYRTTQICDEAGNCWTGTKDFNYNIYANPNSIPAPANTQDITALSSAVADGQARAFIHTIKDGYGNAIIPAPAISRTVTMNLSGISNTMFLNQYTRSGPTSVYITAPNNAVDTALASTPTQTFASDMTSSIGTYPLVIKTYTPTANSYIVSEPISDPFAAFSLTTNLVVNDTLIGMAANRTFSQTLTNPAFRPLYTTSITGDLRNGWFIEGTEQTNTLSIANNNAGVTPAVSLQLEFSGSNSPSFDLYGWTAGNSGTVIAVRNTMSVNPGIAASTDFYTKLVQKQNTQVSNLSNLQFSTHFSYTLDSKNVIYNSDIVGKTGWYWSNTLVQVWNQVWIKIIGPIWSNVIGSIVTGQFSIGTTIFDSFSRSTVRNNLRKSLALATRNTTLSSYNSTISDTSVLNAGWWLMGVVLDKWNNSSIMRIEKTGWNVILNLAGGISGKRTIVIKGANLYITSNMFYNSAVPNSILAIVLQKDDAGNGWNLFISPNVTNLVWTFVLDGSIMSSNDGINWMGTSNIALLKNQLYIYGSIVSENTIGGSRMSPLKCPSLVNTTCATTDESQKYDLNYLRRYYIYGGTGIPFGWAKVIWGAVFSAPTVLSTAFDVNLIKKFSIATEDLAKYPVIVEYNPTIRTNPPIGFEDNRD
jgi:hypothetical protein